MNISTKAKNIFQSAGIFVCTTFAIIALSVNYSLAAPPTFQTLWNNYPTGSDSSAFGKLIGGKVQVNIDGGFFKNTCVLRVSRALNLSGDTIPANNSSLAVSSGADKNWYAYRVSEFHEYMLGKYGTPISSKGNGKDSPPAAMVGKKGIIEFKFKFGNPDDPANGTGHFDLWDGKACKNKCYFDRVDSANNISLWEFK
jgi:Type VI secretion system (T6SS), amidase effector protein 4